MINVIIGDAIIRRCALRNYSKKKCNIQLRMHLKHKKQWNNSKETSCTLHLHRRNVKDNRVSTQKFAAGLTSQRI